MVLSKDDLMFLVGVVAITIFILIAFFISLIIINSKRRQQSEIEKLNAIIAAEDTERTRIAKDMHDDLGPLLSGIKLQINLLSGNSSPDQIETALSQTSLQLDNAIDNIRYIVRNLMPPGLQKHGLIKCILDFQFIVSKSKNTRFEFTHTGMENRFNEAAELNIFRVIHELINNSLKHSDCSQINLDMNLADGILRIYYTDNGKTMTSNPMRIGMGLQNIESRVNLFDGSLTKPLDFTEGAKYSIEFNVKKLF